MSWQTLLPDLKKPCLGFLQPIDLMNFASVSKEFNELVSDEEIWKQHYTKVWESAGLAKLPNATYKNMFLQRLRKTAHRVIRLKCRVINTLFIGDEQTGKTSLINAIHEEYAKEILKYQDDIEKLRVNSLDPDGKNFLRCISDGFNTNSNFYMKFMETKNRQGSEEEKCLDTIREQLLDCDSIVLIYDVTRIETLERLRDFWLPLIRRYCHREVSMLIVGTKSDLKTVDKVDGQEQDIPNSEENNIIDAIKVQYEIDCSRKVSVVNRLGVLHLVNIIEAIVVSPTTCVYDVHARRLASFTEEFLLRVFEFYDKDGDGVLNAEEFILCHNDIFGTPFGVSDSEDIQGQILYAKPDLFVAGGLFSQPAFLHWFESLFGRNPTSVWQKLLRVFNFPRIYFSFLYPPNLQTKSQTLAELLAEPVVKGVVAYTKIADMHRLAKQWQNDEEVKYWIACSLAGISSSDGSHTKILADNGLNNIVMLLKSENPQTARSAAIAIGNILGNIEHRHLIIECKEITYRLVELLSKELDPSILVSVSGPLVELSKEESIQELLIEAGLIKVMPKLLQTEFSELQFNVGQVLYNFIRSKQYEVATKDIIDSIVHIMQSPLPGVVGIAFNCGALAVNELLEFIPVDKNELFFNIVANLATNSPTMYIPIAARMLSIFSANDLLCSKLITKDTFSTIVTLFSQGPKLNFREFSMEQLYTATCNMVKIEKFCELVEIEQLYPAMLTPLVSSDKYSALMSNLTSSLATVASVNASYAQSLVKFFEKELAGCQAEAESLQYLKVIERLSYDMVVHNKDMTSLLDAGFTKFIKNQLNVFKSAKAVILLLQALGILATKWSIADDGLSLMLTELQSNHQLMQEIGVKFVLEWCLGNLNGAGSLDMDFS